MIEQKTLLKRVQARGIGLHSGAQVELEILPAPADTGIRFRRVDLSGVADIEARAENVVDTELSTTLSNGTAQVATVEHLMAAFAGLGVDNALVELSAAELPIMDGSAAPYVVLLHSAGLVEQGVPRKFLRVLQEVCYTENDESAQLAPYSGFRLNYTLHYDRPVLRDHNSSVTLECADLVGTGEQCTMGLDRFEQVFETEVCRARTFGLLEDIEGLRSRNLARGGSLDNAVVMDSSGIMNADGLRQEDELAKHKILDAIGDLYLLGRPVIGAFSGHKSGHRANNRLLRKLLADADNFETITLATGGNAIDGMIEPLGKAARSSR